VVPGQFVGKRREVLLNYRIKRSELFAEVSSLILSWALLQSIGVARLAFTCDSGAGALAEHPVRSTSHVIGAVRVFIVYFHSAAKLNSVRRSSGRVLEPTPRGQRLRNVQRREKTSSLSSDARVYSGHSYLKFPQLLGPVAFAAALVRVDENCLTRGYSEAAGVTALQLDSAIHGAQYRPQFLVASDELHRTFRDNGR
jgi:hypothetical protein